MSVSLTTRALGLRGMTLGRFAFVPRRFAWICALFALSCAGNKADFGTLPQVSVPIESEPEQDPTLFREKTDHTLPSTTTDLPDPRPLRGHDQYDLVVEYQRGEVRVLSVKEIRLSQPASTVRRVGRFALELWTGQELVERVRFDFPLLGASASGAEEDPLGGGLSARTKVRIPASSRATRARILDRKTRKEVEIAWPPGSSALPERGGESGENSPEEPSAQSSEERSKEPTEQGRPSSEAVKLQDPNHLRVALRGGH